MIGDLLLLHYIKKARDADTGDGADADTAAADEPQGAAFYRVERDGHTCTATPLYDDVPRDRRVVLPGSVERPDEWPSVKTEHAARNNGMCEACHADRARGVVYRGPPWHPKFDAASLMAVCEECCPGIRDDPAAHLPDADLDAPTDADTVSDASDTSDADDTRGDAQHSAAAQTITAITGAAQRAATAARRAAQVAAPGSVRAARRAAPATLTAVLVAVLAASLTAGVITGASGVAAVLTAAARAATTAAGVVAARPLIGVAAFAAVYAAVATWRDYGRVPFLAADHISAAHRRVEDHTAPPHRVLAAAAVLTAATAALDAATAAGAAQLDGLQLGGALPAAAYTLSAAVLVVAHRRALIADLVTYTADIRAACWTWSVRVTAALGVLAATGWSAALTGRAAVAATSLPVVVAAAYLARRWSTYAQTPERAALTRGVEAESSGFDAAVNADADAAVDVDVDVDVDARRGPGGAGSRGGVSSDGFRVEPVDSPGIDESAAVNADADAAAGDGERERGYTPRGAVTRLRHIAYDARLRAAEFARRVRENDRWEPVDVSW